MTESLMIFTIIYNLIKLCVVLIIARQGTNIIELQIAENGPKQQNKLSFFQKGKKSLGQSPLQELELGPRCGLYLLPFLILGIIYQCG